MKKFYVLIILLIALPTSAQYVDVTVGNIPILIAIEHDGTMQCGDLTHNGVLQQDTFLMRYKEVLIDEIKQQIGNPYIVRLKCQRKYVDGNRYPSSDIAYNFNNVIAETAFIEYHDEINDAIRSIENLWGNNSGIGINLHTRNSNSILSVMVGYDDKVANWDSNYNTAKTLYDRRGSAALMRIVNEVDKTDPASANSDLNGQATVSQSH
jgi:hypothetical protein